MENENDVDNLPSESTARSTDSERVRVTLITLHPLKPCIHSLLTAQMWMKVKQRNAKVRCAHQQIHLCICPLQIATDDVDEPDNAEAEDLDEDDLALIEENTGIRQTKRKRLKRRQEDDADSQESAVDAVAVPPTAVVPKQKGAHDLTQLFADEEGKDQEEGEVEMEAADDERPPAEDEAAVARPKLTYDLRQEEELLGEDDLDDFIVDDEDEEGGEMTEERRQERIERRRQMRIRPAAAAASLGMSNE